MKTLTDVAWNNQKYYPALGRTAPSRQSLASSFDDLDSSASTDRRSRANSPTWTTWASMSSNSVLRQLRQPADASNQLEVLDLENGGKQQDNTTSRRDSSRLLARLPGEHGRHDNQSPMFGVSEKLPILDIHDSANNVVTDIEKYTDVFLLQRKTSGKKHQSKPDGFTVASPTAPPELIISELRHRSHQINSSSRENNFTHEVNSECQKVNSECHEVNSESHEVNSECSSSDDFQVTWKRSELVKLKIHTHGNVSTDSSSSSSGSFENTSHRLHKDYLGSKTPSKPESSDERPGAGRVNSRQKKTSDEDGTDDTDYQNEAEKSPKSRMAFKKRRDENAGHIVIDSYKVKHEHSTGMKFSATRGERSGQSSDNRERNQNYFNDDDMISIVRNDQCQITNDEKTNQAGASECLGLAFKAKLRLSSARKEEKQCLSSSSSVDSDYPERRKSTMPRLKRLCDLTSGQELTRCPVVKRQPMVSADEKMSFVVSHCQLEPGETVENDVEKSVSSKVSCMTPDSLLIHSQSSNTITSSASQPLHRAAVNSQVRCCIRALISDESTHKPAAQESCSKELRRKEASIFNDPDTDQSDTIKNDGKCHEINMEYDATKQTDNRLSFLAYLMDDGYLAQQRKEDHLRSTTSVGKSSPVDAHCPTEKTAASCDGPSSTSESCKASKKTKHKKTERRLRGILNVEKITPKQKIPKHKTGAVSKSDTGHETVNNDPVSWPLCDGQVAPGIPGLDFLNPVESCSSHNETVIACDVPDVTDLAGKAASLQSDSELVFDNGTDDNIFDSFPVSRTNPGEKNSGSETMFGVNSFDSSTVSNSVSDSTSSSEETTTRPPNTHSFGSLGMFTRPHTRRAKRNSPKTGKSSDRQTIDTKGQIGSYQINSAYSRALIQTAFASNVFSRNTCGYSSYQAPANLKCILPDSSNVAPGVQEIRSLKNTFNVCSGMLFSSSKLAPVETLGTKPTHELCENQSVIKPVTFSSYLEQLNSSTPDVVEIPASIGGDGDIRCTRRKKDTHYVCTPRSKDTHYVCTPRSKDTHYVCTPRSKDTHYVCTPSPRPLLTISASKHVPPICQTFRSKRFPTRPYYFSVHSNASKAKQQNTKAGLSRSTLSDNVDQSLDASTQQDQLGQLGQLREKVLSGGTMTRPRLGHYKWKPLTRSYGSACSRRKNVTDRLNKSNLAKQAHAINSLYGEYACYGGDLPPKNLSMKLLASQRLFSPRSIWRKSRLKHFPPCPIGLQARRKINRYKKCLKNVCATELFETFEPNQNRLQAGKGGQPTNNRQVKTAPVRSNGTTRKPCRNTIYENSIKFCKDKLAEIRNAKKDNKNLPLPSKNNAVTSIKPHKKQSADKKCSLSGHPQCTGRTNGRKCLQHVTKKDDKSLTTQSAGSVPAKTTDVFSRLYQNNATGRCIRNTRKICSELVEALKTDSSCLGSFEKEDVHRLWKMDKDFERVEAMNKGAVAANASEICDKNIGKRADSRKNDAAGGTEDISAHRRMIECIKLVLKKQSEALEAINDSLNILVLQQDEEPAVQCTKNGKSLQNLPNVSNCNKEIVNLTAAPRCQKKTHSTKELEKNATSDVRITQDNKGNLSVVRKQVATIEGSEKLSLVNSSNKKSVALAQMPLLPPRRLVPLQHTPTSPVTASLSRAASKQQCNIEAGLLGDISHQSNLKSRCMRAKPIQTLADHNDTISKPSNGKLAANNVSSELMGVKFYPSPYTVVCRGRCSKNALDSSHLCSTVNCYMPKMIDMYTNPNNQPQKKRQTTSNSGGNLLPPNNCRQIRSSKSFSDLKNHHQGTENLPVLSNPHQNNNSSPSKPKPCPDRVKRAAQHSAMEECEDGKHYGNAVCPCLELCLKKFVIPKFDENFMALTRETNCNTRQLEALRELQHQIETLVSSVHNHSICPCSRNQTHKRSVDPRYKVSGEENHCPETADCCLVSASDNNSIAQRSAPGLLCGHFNGSNVTPNSCQSSQPSGINAKHTSGLSVACGLAARSDLELELYREVRQSTEGCDESPTNDVCLGKRLGMQDNTVMQPSTSTSYRESDVIEENETLLWIKAENDQDAFDIKSGTKMVTQSIQYSKAFENGNILSDISTSEQLSGTIQSAIFSTCHSSDLSIEAVSNRTPLEGLMFYQSQSVDATRQSVHTAGEVCRQVQTDELTAGKSCDVCSMGSSLMKPYENVYSSPASVVTTEPDRVEKLGTDDDINKVATKPPTVQKQRFGIRSWLSKPGSLIKNLKRSDNKPLKQEIKKDNVPKETQNVVKSAKRFGRRVLASPSKPQTKPCTAKATVEISNTTAARPEQPVKAVASSNKETNQHISTHQDNAMEKFQERDKNNSNFPNKYPGNQSINNLSVVPVTSQIPIHYMDLSQETAFSLTIPTHNTRKGSDDKVADTLKTIVEPAKSCYENCKYFESKQENGQKEYSQVEDNLLSIEAPDEPTEIKIMTPPNNNHHDDGVQPTNETTLDDFTTQMNDIHCECSGDGSGDEDITRSEQDVISNTQCITTKENTQQIATETCLSARNADDISLREPAPRIDECRTEQSDVGREITSHSQAVRSERITISQDVLVNDDSNIEELARADENYTTLNPKPSLMICKVNPFVKNSLPCPFEGQTSRQVANDNTLS